ncbi:MAG: cobalamin biosynthesis protein [Beijerinckiaceae bacterium]|uniref:cobalamin biosynthesis protein n=1 Tax=Methylobacterium sp. TaxID=409 RepID=UPI0025FE71E0|nr:cobalamin biosynthesis protein [Methylobacterium sp.]MBX9738665.1 cobalamin biosynthesis protein [Beijerinckiaceae bacterium]MBX9934376.1 cobalamin biosynthesis protein [Methylobacterium sp.]
MAGGPVIVAGFGFRAAATVDSLADALARTGAAGSVAALATLEDKARGEAFRTFAAALSLPVHPVDAKTLARQETLTRSDASRIARGTGSVAEASALAAAGQGAKLMAKRVISGDGLATCALAERDGP